MENEFHKQMAEDFTCLDNPTKLHGSQGCYLGHLQNLVKSWTTRTSLLFYAFLIIGCKLQSFVHHLKTLFSARKKSNEKKTQPVKLWDILKFCLNWS